MTDTPAQRLVLWGVGTSRTLRAHWALHELGLDYDCRPILPRTGETQTREYTELNPRQKVPLLQDGDFRIAESPAIAAYLSNTYGTRENALIPTEPREHATWLEWCFYAATELDATSLYVMRRHGALKHIYGESPVALESAAAYFATQLRHAEQALQDGRPFLVGGRLTTADMLL
ncbi:MAG TPA: glutathione S-transferase family protein, partial [Stellaceae bacterium]|nr:glutathione S-transferase family protein [Stellaceae bacterium]